MTLDSKLATLGITLSPPAPPVGAFVPWIRSGDLVFLAGHVAKRDGQPWVGQLGITMATDAGRAAARAVAVDLLGTLHAAVGDLEQVDQIVKLLVLVNSASTFTEHHLVANGASELLGEVFGQRGVHARSSFGVAQIPFGACVEIELVARVR